IGAGGGAGGGGWAGGGGGAWVDYSSASGGGGGSSYVGTGLTSAIKSGTGGSSDGDSGQPGADGSVSLVLHGLTAPDAPILTSATAGDTQATVAFTTPGSDGGSPITGYTLTSTPGSVTKACPGSPCTISGLTNGTAYTFTLHATNAIGDSTESSASPSVTPVGSPGAPTAARAAAGYGQATVSFAAPAWNGGSAITGYTVTSTPSGLTKTCAGSPCSITGLTNGTTYTFTVHATNSAAPSVESSATNSVTPSAIPVLLGAPTTVVGTASVTVSWTPSSTPGVSGYTVYANPGPATCTTDSASATSCVIGAVAGTSYTYTVRAHSLAGESDPTPASAAVRASTPSVPTSAPTSAPTSLTATPGTLSHVVAGQTLTVTGAGFADFSTVKLIAYSSPVLLATITTDANGGFTTSIKLPATLAAGSHNIVASGVNPDGDARLIRLPLAVEAPMLAVPAALVTPDAAATTAVTAADPAALASTGVPAATLIELGLTFLVTGFAVAATGRRRRRQRA
ncbi:MAG: fibronectin type protein, partial [Frankiales bacterium]|nr:fibronectin type protein [Frankiales bacterium]